MANTVHLKALLLVCIESLASICHGCPFQKSQQTCYEKGQQDLNNIKDLSLVSTIQHLPSTSTPIFCW